MQRGRTTLDRENIHQHLPSATVRTNITKNEGQERISSHHGEKPEKLCYHVMFARICYTPPRAPMSIDTVCTPDLAPAF